MAARKLTRNQQRRVQALHRHHEKASLRNDATTLRTGVVVARFGRQVELEDIRAPGVRHRCHIRANIDSLVAGDRVAWRADGEAPGVVVARHERKSVLLRPDVQGTLRATAANLDQIMIVIAPEPAPHANLLDRYLAAAEDACLRATIVLNKMDLIADPMFFESLLMPYRAIGYRVLCAGAHDASSLAALEATLAAHTSAFVGQSGVGKSSLIAALLPGAEIGIGDLSHALPKGRHTTTTARLYHLPGGGELIDSPGIREFGLEHFDPERVAQGFIEFRDWLGSCRFRDCRHRDEPGCALREAVDQGMVAARRYASYLQIIGT